jgi:hypothetical protein
MTQVPPASPPTTADRCHEVCRTAVALFEQTEVLIRAVHTTCDEARLARARSRELRRQRPGPSCPVCHGPITTAQATYSLAWFGEGLHVAAPKSAYIHQRCFAVWLALHLASVN